MVKLYEGYRWHGGITVSFLVPVVSEGTISLGIRDNDITNIIQPHFLRMGGSSRKGFCCFDEV